MREAAVILFAAAAFTAVAWNADWPAQPACQPVEIIRYLHVSEPAPIYPVPALIKATEIQPPVIADEKEDRAEDHHRRRLRRHRRH